MEWLVLASKTVDKDHLSVSQAPDSPTSQLALSTRRLMEQRSGISSSIQLPSPGLLLPRSSSLGRRLVENPWHAGHDELPIQTSNTTDSRSRGQSICPLASIKSIEPLREALDPCLTDGNYPTEDGIISGSASQTLVLETIPKYHTPPEDDNDFFEELFEPPQMRPTLFGLWTRPLSNHYRQLF